MSCQGSISATVRCKKLILGRDIGWCYRCVTSCYDLDVTFDLALVILTFKTLSSNISKTEKCRKVIVGKDIACRDCRCAS